MSKIQVPKDFQSLLNKQPEFNKYVAIFAREVAKRVNGLSAGPSVVSSSSCGTFSISSTSLEDVTNLNINVTVGTRPVWVGLVPVGTSTSSALTLSVNGTTFFAEVVLLRDGVVIASVSDTKLLTTSETRVYSSPLLLFSIEEGVGVGAHNYKIQARKQSGITAQLVEYKLVAYEL